MLCFHRVSVTVVVVASLIWREFLLPLLFILSYFICIRGICPGPAVWQNSIYFGVYCPLPDIFDFFLSIYEPDSKLEPIVFILVIKEFLRAVFYFLPDMWEEFLTPVPNIELWVPAVLFRGDLEEPCNAWDLFLISKYPKSLGRGYWPGPGVSDLAGV